MVAPRAHHNVVTVEQSANGVPRNPGACPDLGQTHTLRCIHLHQRGPAQLCLGGGESPTAGTPLMVVVKSQRSRMRTQGFQHIVEGDAQPVGNFRHIQARFPDQAVQLGDVDG